MSLDDLQMEPRKNVETFLLSWADDDFVTGQRLAEWVTVGPTLEEDNLLASLAQDEMGHARLWYELVATSESLDSVGYNRSPSKRRNSILVETEHADFADTVVINFLYDTAESLVLEAMQDGEHEDIARRATQAVDEEALHVEHADRWLDRLVTTDEGRTRLEASFERLLPRCADLFAFDPAIVDAVIAKNVLTTDLSTIETTWTSIVHETLEASPLDVDPKAIDAATEPPETNGRARSHTHALTSLLDSIHATNLPTDQPAVNYHQ